MQEKIAETLQWAWCLADDKVKIFVAVVGFFMLLWYFQPEYHTDDDDDSFFFWMCLLPVLAAVAVLFGYLYLDSCN